jgi:hypothetical protein
LGSAHIDVIVVFCFSYSGGHKEQRELTLYGMTKINVLLKHAQLSPTALTMVVHVPLKRNM